MIKMWVGDSSSQGCHSFVAPKQKDVPCVGLVKELCLAKVVEFPGLVGYVFRYHFLANIPLGVSYALTDIVLPLSAFLNISGLEHKLLLAIHNLYWKDWSILRVGLKSVHEMIEVNASHHLIIAFLLIVFHFPISQDTVHWLPMGVDVTRDLDLKEALAGALCLVEALVADYVTFKLFRKLLLSRTLTDIFFVFFTKDVASAAVARVASATAILRY